MKKLIHEWHELWIPEYKERDIDPEILGGDTKKITLLTGCRRAGKTYIMFQLIDRLQKEQHIDSEDIVYINFEDERIEWKTDTLTNLLPTLIELYGERNYHLFLDEIHHIPNWGRWVRRIYDRHKNITIYLTSSSSKLSKKEIPNSLRGRTLTYEVYPLSFKEFASFSDFDLGDSERITDIKQAKIQKLLNQYLLFGGFPEVVLESSVRKKKSIIQDYFRTIITLDVCERYNISNSELVHDYIKLILNQKIHSTNKIYNLMKSQGISVGKETLLDYTHYLEDVYLTFFVKIFSHKIKDRMYYPRKVYFIDNSFINHISIKLTEDSGRQIENIVYLHLLRKYSNENIFYWRDKDNHEIDFVIVDEAKVLSIIQVSLDISDPNTKERELKPFIGADNDLKCKNRILISKDKESIEKYNGLEIKCVPLFKWLQS